MCLFLSKCGIDRGSASCYSRGATNEPNKGGGVTVIEKNIEEKVVKTVEDSNRPLSTRKLVRVVSYESNVSPAIVNEAITRLVKENTLKRDNFRVVTMGNNLGE